MPPRPFRVRLLLLALALMAFPAGRAGAQVVVESENWLERLNPFRPVDLSEPVSVPELCKRLDCVAEKLRDQGLIVLKSPDVFSQARLTRFRSDVDNQMSTDLANFHLVLAARINRLDAATTTQTTALSAALAAPGSTAVKVPDLPDLTKANASGTSLFPGTIDMSKGPFGNLGLATNNFGPITAGTASAALGLGVDPTVYLDEKNRFLQHLNHIRRLNLGPDQNDSSGYGLYLVRLPVSVTPGEKTHHGFGAELAVHVEHEFAPDFLPSTFRSLVINDVVDQLGPFIYEVLRSGYYSDFLKPHHEAKIKQKALMNQVDMFVDGALNGFVNRGLGARGDEAGQPDNPNLIAGPLEKFILSPRASMTGNPTNDQLARRRLADRLTALADALKELDPDTSRQYLSHATAIRREEPIDNSLQPNVRQDLQSFAMGLAAGKKKVNLLNLDMAKFRPFLKELYKTALPQDIVELDNLIGATSEERESVTGRLAQNNAEMDRLRSENYGWLNKSSLPSVRSAKQYYPIAPRELINFFGEENIFLLARDAKEASRTEEVRGNDIRNNLRHTLSTAYDAMRTTTERQAVAHGGSVRLAPLDNEDFMRRLLEAIHQRDFGTPALGLEQHQRELGPPASRLERLNNELITNIKLDRKQIEERPIAALCWAIALDAALLDDALRDDAAKVFAAHELPSDHVDSVQFYHTTDYYKLNPGDPAIGIFEDYVRYRWPIITFSLDPVTDQQNIADSFNLKRDLQLALSFAFATGQIGFNQLNTFRRQIEQSSDTIALNRTVTGFVHGNDVFGFRLTPRFQNPPNQRTNFQVITSQLIGGGPGPDYQLKNSKLEAGIRELTAVLLIPNFLSTMRMNFSANWFRLTDPEHLVFHTKRMMEEGRKVQEVRQMVLDTCSANQYREADLRVLRSKFAMLEAMLPSQSKVIQLPFENSASGFDLFSEGAAALVPELTGFSGVDVIQPPPAAGGGIPGTPVAGSPGLQVTATTTGPATTTTTSISGGTASIADLFVFGKYISLLDTRVIAGGRSAAFEILSREVVHVQIPANVIPTKTEEGGTYIEVFLSTPNGVSNSLLVPYKAAAPTPTIAYDLADDSKSFDVFYQWFPEPDGKLALIATSDPGAKKAINITWNDPTGIGPKTLQATFSGTINGQSLTFALSADQGNSGDYAINAQQFTVALLSRLQTLATTPVGITSPLTLTVNVQPWVPADVQGLRVRTEPKKLKSTLTVNLYYNATNQNVLQGVVIPPPPPPEGGGSASRGTPGALPARGELAVVPGTRDAEVVRAAQSSFSLPSSLTLPQPPPMLNARTLLAPNVTTEAEQVARLLTGQPFNPNLLPPLPPGTTSALTQTNISTSTTSAAAQPIVVMPAPVVVIPPKPDVNPARRKSHFHSSGVLKNLRNRLDRGPQALPGR